MIYNHIKITFKTFDEEIDEQIIERVWALKINQYYKIDNIPFYTYLYSTDDIVEVAQDGEELIVVKLIEASGNSTIRVLFEDIKDLERVRKELNLLNCDSEASRNNKLLAVNIPKSVSYREIIDYLESIKDLQYEESCISEYHKKQN